MKRFSWMLLVLPLVFAACDDDRKGAFTVTVDYKQLDKMVPLVPDSAAGAPANGAKTTRIVLEEVPYGGETTPIILDSVALKGNAGQVVLHGTGKEESIYQVVVDNGPLFLVVNDEDNVQVDLDLSKQENFYTVKNSAASAEMKTFIEEYGSRSMQINDAFARIDSLKKSGASDSVMMIANDTKNERFAGLNTYLQSFIQRTTHPANALLAIGWASRSLETPEFEKSLTDMTRRFPEHQVIKKLKVTYEAQKAQASAQKNKALPATWVGRMAPDLSLPTADGKLVPISSFKGKYLLVDFWASWCGPCRMENPNVVRIYNTFKNKNFTILGVSLDKDKGAWQEAIKSDQLAWAHVSDLKQWNSQAVEMYNIEGIPFNVLIDPQGKIIGESLIGFDLEKKLNEVLQ